MSRLEARDLTGGYPGVTVFSGASFSVESGEILTVLGANGSGKSALLETLQGLLESGGGSILLDDEPVQDSPPEVRARRGMILLSDRRRLWGDMTVGEHLRVGAFRHDARPGWRRRALGLTDLFTGLAERRGARPLQLSGGLQQQLALARLGMSCPRVWMLDDPLQGLDDAMKGRVLDWIRGAAESGAAVILTGQHIRSLLGVARKAMFLEGGSLTSLPSGIDGLRDARVRRLL
jgi:branched-chain amino acid transport system ATP-binding protein